MSSAAPILPPLLHEGDRLNARDFLRRWEAMPDLHRAELIDGTVYMASPVYDDHGGVHLAIGAWVWNYHDATPGLGCGSETTWKMGARDVPQPDVYLRILPEFGGQSSNEGRLVAGAPELIVEVTGSSTSRDLGVKRALYERVGVCEYITVQLYPRVITWRHLVGGRYADLAPGADGLLRSHTFPGLWLDPAAVWSEKKSLRTALNKGIASVEHKAFVKQLAARAR